MKEKFDVYIYLLQPFGKKLIYIYNHVLLVAILRYKQ